MSASACYWIGIACGVLAFCLVVMGLLIRYSCVRDPAEEYQAAHRQEWTVHPDELPDFDWTLAR